MNFKTLDVRGLLNIQIWKQKNEHWPNAELKENFGISKTAAPASNSYNLTKKPETTNIQNNKKREEKIAFLKDLLKVENIPTGKARALFTKYNEVMNASLKIEEYLRDNFGNDKKYNEDLVTNIRKKIREKAWNIVEDYKNDAIDPHKENAEYFKEFVSKLNNPFLIFPNILC